MLAILEGIKQILENQNLSDEDKVEEIFELADPLRRAKDGIASAARPVGIHLAKILMFGLKDIWIKHIIRNLNNLTIGIKLDLPKKRYPTKEEFKQWIQPVISDRDDSKDIIKKAISEWKEEKTKYEKQLHKLDPIDFLDCWNNLIKELSKIYVGNKLFTYRNVAIIIKSLLIN